MVLGALMACLVPAQAQTTQEWQSTSTMKSSGSMYSPQVQQVGAATAPVMATTTTTESNAPTKGHGHIRKGFDYGAEGGEQSTEFPIGDAVVPLMLMAVLFAGVVYLRRKRLAKE